MVAAFMRMVVALVILMVIMVARVIPMPGFRRRFVGVSGRGHGFSLSVTPMPPPPMGGKSDYRLAEAGFLAFPSCVPTSRESHPPEETRALTLRLRKITGQLKAVEGMLAQDYDCPEVLMQLVSARSAIKALSEKLIHSHVEHCIAHASSPADARRKLRDLLTVLERYVD